MNNDDLDPRFKRIAINFDDLEAQRGKAQHPDEEDDSDGPTFTLTMVVTFQHGAQTRFSKIFTPNALDQHIFIHPDTDADFEHASRWISILGLAGADTFSTPEEKSLFAQPRNDWPELYFSELPRAVARYGDIFWSTYAAVELSFHETGSDEMIQLLRLVPPTGEAAESQS